MAAPASHSLLGQLSRIGRVVGFVWPFTRDRVLLTLVLLLAAGLTEGVSILLIVPVLARLVPGATTVDLSMEGMLPGLGTEGSLQLELLPLLALVVVAVVLQGLLARMSTLTLIDTTLTAAGAVRTALFRAVGFARWQKIMQGRHADITHSLTMDVDRIQVVLNSLLFMIQAVIMLSLYVGLSLLVSPTMTAFAVGAGVLFLAALHPLRTFASRYGETLSDQRQSQYRTIGEFLTGLKVVKSLNAEGRYVDAFSNNSNALTRDIKRLARVSALPGFLFQSLSAIGAAGFVFVSVRYAGLSVERIAVMLFLFMRIAPRFTSLQAHYQNLIINVGGYDNVRAVLQGYGEDQDPPLDGAGERLPLRSDLTFEDVTFGYDPTQPPILSSMSFRIPAGEITAVIGASGSGKSTVADLILGLLEPSSGVVRIDGVALSDTVRRRWRAGIGYVPQEVYLLNASISDNLRFAAPDASDARLWEALDQAQAGDLVRALPEGMATMVGERGIRLSGGERQRIALARALLREPGVLILDEATSALDWQNQRLIAEAIKALRGRMTIVTIAHRASMIAFADWVVAIDAGRVVETGRFADSARRADSLLARLLAGEGVGRSPAGSDP